MPKREDEYWASTKGRAPDTKPVQVNKSRLSADDLHRILTSDEKPELKKCPGCKKVSLAWDTQFLMYICMNNKCGKLYARDQV